GEKKINKTKTITGGKKTVKYTDDGEGTWEKVDAFDESEEGGIDNVRLEMDLMPEVQYEKPDWSNILHGKFVLVGFIGGQRKKEALQICLLCSICERRTKNQRNSRTWVIKCVLALLVGAVTGVCRNACERPKIMFTKLEQRSWIKIEVARGRSTQECFQGLREACGDVSLPYRSAARWVTAFRVGRDVVNDNPRTGRPHVENNTVQLLASLLDVDHRWTARAEYELDCARFMCSGNKFRLIQGFFVADHWSPSMFAVQRLDTDLH
ncbi:hypothetical protein C0J52_20022, partial [Blattella germanica]